jgi:F-type H+-transporting ATPase subunit b
MQQETLWSNPRTWVGVAFILFFVIFGRRLWAVISKLLDDHTAAVRAELEEASRLRREAETMLRDAKARRVAALAEAKALIEGAKAQAERVSAATAAEAAESASRRERMAMDRIAAAEKAAVDEVRQTAAEIATVAARRLLAEGLTAEADAGLIDHAIAGLPQALRAA